MREGRVQLMSSPEEESGAEERCLAEIKGAEPWSPACLVTKISDSHEEKGKRGDDGMEPGRNSRQPVEEQQHTTCHQGEGRKSSERG